MQQLSTTTLKTIAAAPPGKLGWPWMEETAEIPSTMPDGKPWPRITVVTPSYNQGQFLERTIRSVLLQGYPNLEYIIIDGGSSDESVQIIKQYERHLAYWLTEPDRGQSHAINKGFARATGQIMSWLNSDDYYLPGTLQLVAETLADGTGNFALVGHCVLEHQDGRPDYCGLGRFEGLERLLQFWKGYQMHQPSIFWRREVFEKIGFLDEAQHYIMDFDYWVRIARNFDFQNVDRVLSHCTYHARAKTGDGFANYMRDLRKHASSYWGSPFRARYWKLRASLVVNDLASIGRRLTNSVSYRAELAFRSISGQRYGKRPF